MNDQITAWHNEHGLAARIVLVYDNNWQPPNQAFCQAFRQQVGIEVPLLYDATGGTGIYRRLSDNKLHETTLITNEEGIIAFKTHKDTESGIVSNVLAELSADFGECSSVSVCGSDESCLPTPLGVAKRCAAICDPTENEACLNNQTCYVYTANAATGACFPDEIIP